ASVESQGAGVRRSGQGPWQLVEQGDAQARTPQHAWPVTGTDFDSRSRGHPRRDGAFVPRPRGAATDTLLGLHAADRNWLHAVGSVVVAVSRAVDLRDGVGRRPVGGRLARRSRPPGPWLGGQLSSRGAR